MITRAFYPFSIFFKKDHRTRNNKTEKEKEIEREGEKEELPH